MTTLADIKRFYKKPYYFASGEEVPERLEEAWLQMRLKICKNSTNHALLELPGEKFISVPCPAPAETAIFQIMESLGGVFHGIIVVLRG